MLAFGNSRMQYMVVGAGAAHHVPALQSDQNEGV